MVMRHRWALIMAQAAAPLVGSALVAFGEDADRVDFVDEALDGCVHAEADAEDKNGGRNEGVQQEHSGPSANPPAPCGTQSMSQEEGCVCPHAARVTLRSRRDPWRL